MADIDKETRGKTWPNRLDTGLILFQAYHDEAIFNYERHLETGHPVTSYFSPQEISAPHIIDDEGIGTKKLPYYVTPNTPDSDIRCVISEVVGLAHINYRQSAVVMLWGIPVEINILGAETDPKGRSLSVQMLDEPPSFRQIIRPLRRVIAHAFSVPGTVHKKSIEEAVAYVSKNGLVLDYMR